MSFPELHKSEDLFIHTHTHTYTQYHVYVRSLVMSQSARISTLVFDPMLRHLLSLKKNSLFEQNRNVQQVTSNK
jgi:hypothetical protein